MLDGFGGFEAGSYQGDGWGITAGGVATETGRKDPDGNGGAVRIRGSFVNTVLTKSIPACEAFRFGRHFRHDATGTQITDVLRWLASATMLGLVRYDESTQKLAIYTGTATLRATSAGSLSMSTDHWLEIRVLIGDSSGQIDVYVDEDYSAPFVSYTGDTKPGADTQANAIAVEIEPTQAWDEWYHSRLTLQYDNDNGAGTGWTAGQAVTGATSGATATISSVSGGVMVLYGWTGTAFQDNELIGNGTGRTAQVDAPRATFESGLQPGSLWLGNVYCVELVPTGTGNYSQLDGSDGDAVNNYALVDESGAGSSADYVEGQAIGEKDSYLLADTTADRVKAVKVQAEALHLGATLVKARLGLRIAGVDYVGSEIATGIAYAPIESVFAESPTLAAWTPALINGAEVLVEVRGT